LRTQLEAGAVAGAFAGTFAAVIVPSEDATKQQKSKKATNNRRQQSRGRGTNGCLVCRSAANEEQQSMSHLHAVAGAGKKRQEKGQSPRQCCN